MAFTVVRAQRWGFTLIEVLVVMTIVVVVAALSAPAFSRLLEASRVRTEATRLMSDIVLTRSEAVKRNRAVVMCPTAVSAAGDAQCGGSYKQGWLVFDDADGDRELDATEYLIRRRPGLTSGLGITNRAATRAANEVVVFQADGSSGRNLTLMVCSGRIPGAASWSVVMNIIGRPRLARNWGQCPGPAG